LKLHHHRRYTANHTWHLDLDGYALFVKANPNRSEAQAEVAGHTRLQAQYPAPTLHARFTLPGWTVLVYDRWLHRGKDSGLLLDLIAQAEWSGDLSDLDACLDDVIGHYRTVIEATVQLIPPERTIGKLYGQRAAPGGRLDTYYGELRPWRLSVPNSLRGIHPYNIVSLDVNDTAHCFDFAAVLQDLRRYFSDQRQVWAALTQGDPTDFNIGWSRESGPIWFDYDTAGLNAIAGEFANFLLYQRLHGPWLTPRYNPDAFADHQPARRTWNLVNHEVQVHARFTWIHIEYHHVPGRARRHVMARYLHELVLPVAEMLGIDDIVAWLRPYLLMRLLAVYDVTQLDSIDAWLCLALTAETLDPRADLDRLLALEPANEKAS
jgi:hypothetical protein